ncbi:MAG: zinc-dependent alcohol dehydrogenase, partial [Planctomycetota bacterium]
MKAAVLVAREEVEIAEVDMPEPGPYEVVVAPKYASICGTDVHIWEGQFEGRVKYPTVMGHEFAGIVEAVGKKVREISPGDKVTVDPIIPCMHCVACREGNLSACRSLRLRGVDLDGGFAEAVVVGEEQLFQLPERLSVRDGAMVEIFSVATHAIRRGQIDPADFVVVLGAGRLGLAILSVLKTTGAGTIVATDVLEYRLDIARKIGADYCINVSKKDPVEEILSLTEGQGADRVFEAVGLAEKSASGLAPVAEATQMIRNAGRVIVLGQGPEPEPVLWRPFVWKEATLVASRVSRGEFPRAIRMLEQGLLDPSPLVTHEVPLDYVPEAMKMLAEGSEQAVKVLV